MSSHRRESPLSTGANARAVTPRGHPEKLVPKYQCFARKKNFVVPFATSAVLRECVCERERERDRDRKRGMEEENGVFSSHGSSL